MAQASYFDTARLTWFARAWAVAALFHLAGNPRDALNTNPALAILTLLLAAAAAATLLRPHDKRPLTALCALVPLHAWQEAPVVGNHWVLYALLSLALLLTACRRALVPMAQWQDFIPTARLTLLIAYGFAAFAKINADFLNPAVSCAVYYHDQLVNSWGLPALQVSGSPGLGRAMALLAMLTELAVFLMVSVPWTRRAGLALAFCFHWLLAMDLDQHFWDFSSVLFAGFLLFLDDAQIACLEAWKDRVTRLPFRPVFLKALVILAGVTIGGLSILPISLSYDDALVEVGHFTWLVYGTTMVLLILGLLFHSDMKWDSHRIPLLLLVIPTLAVLNGLTPYFEIKTGFGWNMYSNLRTVGGYTNHLLLPGTLDLTGKQRDLVYIVNSSNSELNHMKNDEYALTYSEFRKFARRYPEGAVTYKRHGVVQHVQRLGDSPPAQEYMSVLETRLLSFRPVDLQPAERCLPFFNPAR
ncbi:hypothetical protein [Deinococcus navajonensis]|uniref:Vitamin K-dependent gamma-carboxylase-like protein n=1 Tax=Deinococcus navajonensis TaxID=309884 RepID=A0ABV8XN91_9DEIO